MGRICPEAKRGSGKSGGDGRGLKRRLGERCGMAWGRGASPECNKKAPPNVTEFERVVVFLKALH